MSWSYLQVNPFQLVLYLQFIELFQKGVKIKHRIKFHSFSFYVIFCLTTSLLLPLHQSSKLFLPRGQVLFHLLMFILNDKVRKRGKQRKKPVYTPMPYLKHRNHQAMFFCGTFLDATFVFHWVWDCSSQGQGLNKQNILDSYISWATLWFLYYHSFR